MSLPSGYAQLAYIKSSGAQYIDTGVAAAKDLKVEAIMDVDESSTWIMILGDYTSSKYFSWWAKENLAYAYFGSKSGTLTFSAGKHTYIADGPNNKWEIDGTSITMGPASSDFSGAGGTLYLFSVHNGGSYASASVKLYSCKIYKNGTLIRDFVPCRNASGTLGLYDLTNNRFYENSGSGDFEGPYYGPLKNSCLIDGATYQIKNGKVLIGGAKYQIGGGKTLLGGTAFDIPFAKGSYTIDMSWRYVLSQYDSAKDIQMPKLTYPSTEGRVPFGSKAQYVYLSRNSMTIQMTPGILKLQVTGNCNTITGDGVTDYHAASDYKSMIFTIQATKEGTYIPNFNMINPCLGDLSAYVKVLSFEPT